jgi:hypothetical protein
MQCSTSSCSSGCGGHVVPCPCPEGGNPEIDSLEKIVNCFWQKHQDLAVERDYYEGLESLADAIDEAAQALGDENLDYDQPDVIPAPVLDEARQRLLASVQELSECDSFESLFDRVQQALDGLDGLTPALRYLTALRIGLQAGLHPEKIYLAAGARDGGSALIALDDAQATLSRDQLPRIFQHPDLTTEDVQSCLAICRNQLRWLNVASHAVGGSAWPK